MATEESRNGVQPEKSPLASKERKPKVASTDGSFTEDIMIGVAIFVAVFAITFNDTIRGYAEPTYGG